MILALDATPIFLPNFSRLKYDDILEMRLKANDELRALRCFLSELSSKYDPDDHALATAKDFIENDISKSIKEFENKVFGLKIGTIQRALKNLANPLTYAPMLTTVFANIPTYISLAVSLGIITAEAALEYQKQKSELKADPLYFTVELKKHGKSGRR